MQNTPASNLRRHALKAPLRRRMLRLRRLACGVGGAHGWLGWLEGAGCGSTACKGIGAVRSPPAGVQSVIRFEVRSNEIKWLPTNMSKRITLCLRGDTARRLSRFFAWRRWVRLVMHGVPLVARQWSFRWTLPITSPCPPMPACSNRGCASFQKPPGHLEPSARQEQQRIRARTRRSRGRRLVLCFWRQRRAGPSTTCIAP